VIPKPRTSALAESSDIETLKPGAGTPPLPEPHFPPPAQSPATDLAALQPRTSEPDAETEDLCIAEAVTDDLCVAEAETEGLGVAEATEDLCVAEAETEDLCVAEAETEDLRVAEAAADDLSVAEALIPEPRTGDEPAPVQPDLGLSAPAEEPSAIYVAAPDRQTAPELQAAPELQTVPDRQAAPVAEPENSAEVAIPQPRAEAEAEVEDDPEQLELALVLESEAVHFDPRMFPDRTIHIPYPRQASS
jgi:hypothetical protein